MGSAEAKRLAIIGPDELQLPQALLKRVAEMNGLDISYPYQYLPKGQSTLNRKSEDIASGELDVFWNMTNQSLEDEFRAIKIPVFRGLFGLRISLISADKAGLFSRVTNIQQMQHYTAGSGADWPDTTILENNRLPVVTAVKYNNMFRMLDGGRYDYFPRGLNEPWNELETNASLNLMVDPHLMFRYLSPVYFFVKKDSSLGDVIESSLNTMLDSGEFEALFLADSEVKQALARANIEQRIVFELDNPNLPDGTPVDDQRLWFIPEFEKKD